MSHLIKNNKTRPLQRYRHISHCQNCTFGKAEKWILWYSESVDNQCVYLCQNRSDFTGKEKDVETGYGYFGARYMDHELMTMWLSVDPMAYKYPSISPYAYCAWNPVKLLDPNGMKFDSASMVYVNWFKEKTNELISINPYYISEYRKAINELEKLELSSQSYHICINNNSIFVKGETSYDLNNNYVLISFDGNVENLAHEFVHAYQFETGDLSFSESLGLAGVLYDIHDEMQAYRRQTFYNINFKMPNIQTILKINSGIRNSSKPLSVFSLDYDHEGEFYYYQTMQYSTSFSSRQIYRLFGRTYIANDQLN